MGWLGWTPEVALATDVAMIEAALESRSDLLTMIFGSGKKTPPKGKQRGKGGVSATQFKAFAKRTNGARKKDG